MQILAGIVLLGVLITFHELGHFLFAKWLGVRVLVFSVGFGPKIWSFKRKETEYRLSIIPLGGYVRMYGESLDEDLTAEQKKMSFLHQPIWRKSLIAFAGPLFNFILPIILFFCLLLGTEQVFAPKIGTLAKGGAAEKAGLMPHDLIKEIGGKKVKSFSEVADIISKNPEKDLLFTIERKDQSGKIEEQTITLKTEGKASLNPLEQDQMVGRIGIMPAILRPIVAILPGSPLLLAGLKDLDEITKIDGRNIESKTVLDQVLMDLKPGQKIEIKRTIPGESQVSQIVLTVPENLAMAALEKPIEIKGEIKDDEQIKSRIEQTREILLAEQASFMKNWGIVSANGLITDLDKESLADQFGLELKDRLVAVDGELVLSTIQLEQAIISQAQSPHVLGVLKNNGQPLIMVISLPSDTTDRINLNTDLDHFFGIKVAQVFASGEIITRSVGPVEAIQRAVLQTIDIAWMTGKSLVLLITQKVPASQIGGPIMLFDVAQQAAKKGLSYYIFIMCLLSVNLGLLNLLPIPALDGGHLLLFGIEAVQGRPLSQKTRSIATQIGIAILLLIMAFAIFNDISRLF